MKAIRAQIIFSSCLFYIPSSHLGCVLESTLGALVNMENWTASPESLMYRHTSFTVLYSMVLHRYCIFYKLKICGNPALSNSTGAIFLTAFAHFMS